jgi:ribosomal protein S18 acetylase RimI-like enzyme
MTGHPLDNPVRSSLLGPQSGFAERVGQALRYPADVSPFVTVPDDPDESDWRDLADLLGPGGIALLAAVDVPPPADWPLVGSVPGVQLVGSGVAGEQDDELLRLGPADVPEMLELAARTKPGPFLPRTIELGTYLGLRRGGELVAMAGERMHPPGWTELSAVCTDPGWRGHGLGTRLIRALVAGIRARGETPFLHAAADNTSALRLYEALGFELRRPVSFRAFGVPANVLVHRSE